MMAIGDDAFTQTSLYQGK